jgi:hypothetical protein
MICIIGIRTCQIAPPVSATLTARLYYIYVSVSVSFPKMCSVCHDVKDRNFSNRLRRQTNSKVRVKLPNVDRPNNCQMKVGKMPEKLIYFSEQSNLCFDLSLALVIIKTLR